MKRTKKEPWKVIRNGSVEVVIYQEANGYRAAWYFAKKRERRFFSDAADAVGFAKKQAVSLGDAQPKNDTHIQSELRYLQQMRERLGKETPPHVAVDYYLMHHKRQQLLPAKPSDLWSAFIASQEQAELSPGYVDALATYVKPWVDSARGMLHEQRSNEIAEWSKAKTKSIHSRWHFTNYLRTFFNWSRDERKALPEGKTEADLVTAVRPKPPVIEIYTPEEMRILFKYAANKGERGLLALGGFVGLRNSEITGERTNHGALNVEDIHFDDMAVRVTQKAQQDSVERYPPLLPNALSWLLEFKDESGPIIQCALAATVIQGIITRAKRDKQKIEFKRNGLRRSYISYRTAITRDVPRVADECNTSPAKIRRNYRKPGLEKPAHEYFAISRISALPSLSDPLPAIDGATPEALSAGS